MGRLIVKLLSFPSIMGRLSEPIKGHDLVLVNVFCVKVTSFYEMEGILAIHRNVFSLSIDMTFISLFILLFYMFSSVKIIHPYFLMSSPPCSDDMEVSCIQCNFTLVQLVWYYHRVILYFTILFVVLIQKGYTLSCHSL